MLFLKMVLHININLKPIVDGPTLLVSATGTANRIYR